MKKWSYWLICSALLPCFVFADPPFYGATLSLPLIPKEPPQLRGFQMMFNYDPQKYQWRKFNVYFDGGFTYFYQTSTSYHSVINIYSLAPVIRYTFRRRGPVLPYLELSIGMAYLNQTRFEDRNLGIHFAFQDRMGIGAMLGHSDQYTLGIHAVHYSNAHLSAHNSGISVPLVLDLGYRFL